jgi:hypothetical protein
LRALENGYRIRVVETDYESIRRGYAGGSGTCIAAVRSLARRGEGVWLNIYFVTGGVVSSLGKGHCRRFHRLPARKPRPQSHLQKFDPYLNVDPGTMSPFQHGEVFVTDDGAETDLDLGHYERFTHARSRRQQPDQRPHLRADHHARAPRRLSGQDRAGDPARHQRNQGRHAKRVSRPTWTW